VQSRHICIFQCLGELVDIGEAISADKDAIRLTPDGHSNKPRYLNHLGKMFLRRFEHSEELVDIEEAISAHKDAAANPYIVNGESDVTLSE
jgi:hypothetical protein